MGCGVVERHLEMAQPKKLIWQFVHFRQNQNVLFSSFDHLSSSQLYYHVYDHYLPLQSHTDYKHFLPIVGTTQEL